MLALLFIDFDGFKDINDTQGHAEGDKVLRAASLRLNAVLRPGDHVVRLGGDEFVVLLDPVEDDSRAEQVAQRIAIAFDEPFYLGSERLLLTGIENEHNEHYQLHYHPNGLLRQEIGFDGSKTAYASPCPSPAEIGRAHV